MRSDRFAIAPCIAFYFTKSVGSALWSNDDFVDSDVDTFESLLMGVKFHVRWSKHCRRGGLTLLAQFEWTWGSVEEMAPSLTVKLTLTLTVFCFVVCPVQLPRLTHRYALVHLHVQLCQSMETCINKH